jgi:hypothetical protein
MLENNTYNNDKNTLSFKKSILKINIKNKIVLLDQLSNLLNS